MRRPNMVFTLTEQQRWDTTGVHGNQGFSKVACQATWVIARSGFCDEKSCFQCRRFLALLEMTKTLGLLRSRDTAICWT